MRWGDPSQGGREAYPEGMEVPETIICVECGAAAGRLSRLPAEEDLLPGDVVIYLCPDCGHRFDIVLEDDGRDEE